MRERCATFVSGAGRSSDHGLTGTCPGKIGADQQSYPIDGELQTMRKTVRD